MVTSKVMIDREETRPLVRPKWTAGGHATTYHTGRSLADRTAERQVMHGVRTRIEEQ